MSTWINVSDRVIPAISIKIQTKRIRPSTGKGITTNKSTRTWIVVSRSKVNRTRFSIIILTTITGSIRIWIINILLNTESVILVCLSNFTICICKIYNIAVSVLGIVGILWLISIFVIVLNYKVCATDITVSFIEPVVDNICNNLLTAIPNMICCLTSYKDCGAKLTLEVYFAP